MHIAAAIGTPTVAIFGPTSPRLWAPLDPLAAIVQPSGSYADIKDRSTSGVQVEAVLDAVRTTLPTFLPTHPHVHTRRSVVSSGVEGARA